MTMFPADVSMRILGDDLAGGQGLYPLARQLLTRALMVRGDSDKVVRMQIPGVDGSLVRVALTGNLKHVYITPPPRGKPAKKQGETFDEPPITPFFPYSMWSGVARPSVGTVWPSDANAKPQIITGPNDEPPPDGTVPLLDQFHPDAVTAAAYARAFAWQQPHRLGVNDAGVASAGDAACAFPKPGCYSGAMKRCVQAILGIGNIQTDTEEFISEELPLTAPDLAVWNQYDWTWLRTHGIHKSPNDGAVWLIEVSKLNGVLAMPLPIFKGTESGAFLNYVIGYGDTDTLNVLLEFGGLPTGEKYPTGTDLTDAIAAGKVLQLLTAGDIAEFYRDSTNAVDKSGLYTGQGWAFSESGAAADNLTFWHKNPTCALIDDATFQGDTDGLGNSPLEDRHVTSQWWRLTFNLSAVSSEANPFGSGAATLSLVEEEVVVNDIRRPDTLSAGIVTGGQSQPLMLVPSDDDNELFGGARFQSRTSSGLHVPDDTPELGRRAPVHLFYDGERVEVVRFVPFGAGFFWDVAGFIGDSIDLDIASLFIGTSVRQTGAVMLAIPNFCREGYVLFKADMAAALAVPDPKPDGLTFPVIFKGFYPRIGVIDLGGFDELFICVLSLVPYVTFYTLSHKWLETFGGLGFTGGANFNAGPTLGYVLSNGLGVGQVFNSSTPGGPYVFRNAYFSYLQPDAIADLDVPIDTRAEDVTFVGSP
jgi:hypothetical protein